MRLARLGQITKLLRSIRWPEHPKGPEFGNSDLFKASENAADFKSGAAALYGPRRLIHPTLHCGPSIHMQNLNRLATAFTQTDFMR